MFHRLDASGSSDGEGERVAHRLCAGPDRRLPMINVRIVQLGKGVHEHTMEPGTTVERGLVAAGVPTDRMEVRVRGRRVELTEPLQDGDLVTVIPLIRGGARASNRGRRLRDWTPALKEERR